MLGTDYLFALERFIDEKNTIKPTILEDFRTTLNAIYCLPEYQEWLSSGQFKSAADPGSRFYLPAGFGESLTREQKWILDQFNLVTGDRLEAKIDRHNNRVHLTDGPWVPPTYRVYSFADESELLCNHVREQSFDGWADIMIDPACGCGHHALGLENAPSKLSLDINLRSLAFCRLNALLSGAPEMLCGINDIRDGMPAPVRMLGAKNILFVINMPFAIHPKSSKLESVMPLAQDGGDRGIALTFAAIDAVGSFAKDAPHVEEVKAVILFYSLGRQISPSVWDWEVERYVHSRHDVHKAEVVVLSQHAMWRVNGVKAEPNPMPIEMLKKKALCRHTFPLSKEAEVRSGYAALENAFRVAGYTHLGYGLLSLTFRKQR